MDPTDVALMCANPTDVKAAGVGLEEARNVWAAWRDLIAGKLTQMESEAGALEGAGVHPRNLADWYAAHAKASAMLRSDDLVTALEMTRELRRSMWSARRHLGATIPHSHIARGMR